MTTTETGYQPGDLLYAEPGAHVSAMFTVKGEDCNAWCACRNVNEHGGDDWGLSAGGGFGDAMRWAPGLPEHDPRERWCTCGCGATVTRDVEPVPVPFRLDVELNEREDVHDPRVVAW